jgi:flagellar hook-associated protein 3 FlgL
MLTRTGDYAHSQLTTQLLIQAQTRVRDTQVQISTGKESDHFSGIASDANQLLAAKGALQRIEQYQSNNNLVGQRLAQMDSSLGGLDDLGNRLKTLLIQRLNDASSVPGTVSAEATQLLDQVVGDLNVQFGDQYLFGGSRTDAPPVVLDPSFSNFGSPDDTFYQGDNVELTVRADDNREMTYGMTADQPGFQELIGAMRAAIEGDGSNDKTLLNNALDLLNSAMPKIDGYRSEIGARESALDRINNGHADAQLYLEKQVSDVQDVDMTDAITRMTQDQMVVESSMATIARLSQLSLVDFLR